MLKVIRGNLVFIVPNHWIDGWGYLKPTAVCALKVFFGDKTNREADRELEKREASTRRGVWQGANIDYDSKKEGNV